MPRSKLHFGTDHEVLKVSRPRFYHQLPLRRASNRFLPPRRGIFETPGFLHVPRPRPSQQAAWPSPSALKKFHAGCVAARPGKAGDKTILTGSSPTANTIGIVYLGKYTFRPLPRCTVRVRWVIGCPFDYVSTTSGVPQIADDLLHGTKSSASGHEETFLPFRTDSRLR
jgi:hypothetical protein